MTNKEQELLDALEPQANEQGVELVAIEIVGAKKAPTIRIYIDTPQGVSFDELSSAQAWINEVVEAKDPFTGAYTLEVSSPGIDRPLRTREHFEKFAGETAVIQLVSPVDGRGKYTGILKGMKDDKVLLEVDGEREEIAFENVKRARLKGTVCFS